MGMLGGLLAGVGQGVQTMGGAMMYGAQEEQKAATRERERQQDFEREKQMMLERLRAARQSAKDQREDQFSFENDPANVEKANTTAATRAKAAATTATDIEKTQLGDTDLQAARRTKAADDAKAQAQTELDILKSRASDKEGLKALEKIKLNDPEVRARIETARASAAHAYAGAEKERAQTGMVKMQTAELQRFQSLYDKADAILTDKSLSDEDRTKQFTEVQSQINLMKKARGAGPQRDPEFDKVVVTEEKMNPDGSTTKTQRTEQRKAGHGGGSDKAPYADGTELKGKDGKVYVVQDGQPVPKQAAQAAAAPQMRDPLSGQVLTEQEWDRKYGRGEFKRAMAREPSIKPI